MVLGRARLFGGSRSVSVDAPAIVEPTGSKLALPVVFSSDASLGTTSFRVLLRVLLNRLVMVERTAGEGPMLDVGGPAFKQRRLTHAVLHSKVSRRQRLARNLRLSPHERLVVIFEGGRVARHPSSRAESRGCARH